MVYIKEKCWHSVYGQSANVQFVIGTSFTLKEISSSYLTQEENIQKQKKIKATR